MADEPLIGRLSRPARRQGDREAVLAAACNVLARHHHKVTGGSAPTGPRPAPSPEAGARPGAPGSGP